MIWKEDYTLQTVVQTDIAVRLAGTQVGRAPLEWDTKWATTQLCTASKPQVLKLTSTEDSEPATISAIRDFAAAMEADQRFRPGLQQEYGPAYP